MYLCIHIRYIFLSVLLYVIIYNVNKRKYKLLWPPFIIELAKIPAVARDSLRNEVTREMNYGIIYNQS
jgi:hypothetical protein